VGPGGNPLKKYVKNSDYTLISLTDLDKKKVNVYLPKIIAETFELPKPDNCIDVDDGKIEVYRIDNKIKGIEANHILNLAWRLKSEAPIGVESESDDEVCDDLTQ